MARLDGRSHLRLGGGGGGACQEGSSWTGKFMYILAFVQVIYTIQCVYGKYSLKEQSGNEWRGTPLKDINTSFTSELSLPHVHGLGDTWHSSRLG